MIQKLDAIGERALKELAVAATLDVLEQVRISVLGKKGALSDGAYEALLEDKITPIFEALKAKCRDEGKLSGTDYDDICISHERFVSPCLSTGLRE